MKKEVKKVELWPLDRKIPLPVRTLVVLLILVLFGVIGLVLSTIIYHLVNQYLLGREKKKG